MTAEDFLVLNYNQEKLKEMAVDTAASIVPFSTTTRCLDGAYSHDGVIYYKDEQIMQVSELSLPGDHNLENALAAICVTKLSGISNTAIKDVL